MNTNTDGRKATRNAVPVNPNDGWHEIMALSGQSWGRGADATEARRGLRANTSRPVERYLVVPKGAWIDDMGRAIEWDLGAAGPAHSEGKCPLCMMT